MANGNNTEGVTTPAPISDADTAAQDELDRQERRRLIEERKNAPPCWTVCDDGLYAGKALEVRCVGVWPCLNRGGCFWRHFHQIPTGKQRKNCDAGLDD